MSPILEIRNMTAGYGRQFSLKNISFSFDEHGIIGIIGPNGSGKTTLLKVISRLLKPGNGNVLFRGTDIWKMGIKSFSQKVAVISQSIDFAPLSVYDYVMMGRIPHRKPLQFFETGADMEKTEKYMTITGIRAIGDKLLDSISGGERQMAQFAKALNQEPGLLLMDEPTSHLDIKHQVGILDLTRQYNKETGLTIIIVLHDLNLASEYCDQLILLKDGCIRYSGSPPEVLNYRTIEEIYETVVIVEKNPLSHKPYVFLVSGEELEKR